MSGGFAAELDSRRILLLEGDEEATRLAAGISGSGRLYVLEPWALNQFPVERVEDLPIRLTGIAGWMPGKWPECRRQMLRGEPALPLAECVNPLFLDLIKADREYTRARFDKAIFAEPHEAFRDEAGNPEPVGARGRVQILGEEGRDPFTEIEDGGLDVVWLSGEIGYTPLLQEVPRWRRKFPAVTLASSQCVAGAFQATGGGASCPPNVEVGAVKGAEEDEALGDPPAGSAEGRTGWKRGVTHRREARCHATHAGLVCGGFHDIENWPESTACVEMLQGTPEVVTAEGEWLKRVFSLQFSVGR